MRRKRIGFAVSVLALTLLLCACSARPAPAAADPHAGMVAVPGGEGTEIWVKEYDDVPVSPLWQSAQQSDGSVLGADGTVYDVSRGIDVSEHQGEIDWELLADGDVDYALLRIGYRGYGEAGKLQPDLRFGANYAGAAAAGIPVGAYFFSQATSTAEAESEAVYVLRLLEDYGPEGFDLPVFFDWEYIDFDLARTDIVSGNAVTDFALAFCQRLREAGYEAGIYAYRHLAYYNYDLARIRDYPLWIGALGTEPDFYYDFAIWQFSTEGKVAGIDGDVDLNLMYLPRAEAAAEPAS